MNKSVLFGIIGVILMSGLGAIIWASSSNPDTTESTDSATDEELSIITTLYPQYDFARTIAPNANVELLLPAGTEPHSFEPTPRDIEAIRNADLFIYTGESMEPWVTDLLTEISQDRILDLSTSITLLESDHSHEEEHSHDHEEEHNDHSDEFVDEMSKEHEHEYGEYDPHYWLDLSNAATMASAISTKLEVIHPSNAGTYSSNSQILTQELINLDQIYTDTLSQCEENTLIIAGHSAFGYLAQRYGLMQEAALSISPNAEPSATRVVELINLINEKNAGAVFSEELLSDRLAQTISNETGAQVLQITPAGNISREALDANVSFIDIMESNLEQLSTGLSCR